MATAACPTHDGIATMRPRAREGHFGLPADAVGGNVLSVKLVEVKSDADAPAEIDDCRPSYFATLGRRI